MGNPPVAKKVVILASGGLDSCIMANNLKLQGFELYFMHCSYGQRAAAQELKCFLQQAEYFSVRESIVIDVSYLKQIGGSELFAGTEKVGLGRAYVPFRNGNLLAAATSWAEVMGVGLIAIGADLPLLTGGGFPDDRRRFFTAFERAMNLGTRSQAEFRITAPLSGFSKEQIIKKGIDEEAPIKMTRSCYGDHDLACGVCDSCILRLRGFHLLGMTDRIFYV